MRKIKLVLLAIIFINYSFISYSRDLPASFADLAEKLMPSVVNISTTQTIVTTNTNPFPFEFPPGSPFEDLFKEFGTPKERKASALGSGFIIDSNGIVITNNHVIEHCSQIKLKVNNSLIDALVVARDEVNDLALLKTKTDKSIPIPMSRANPELLEDIYAAGFPFGDAINSAVKVTKGIVSSLSGMSNNFSNVQIDAALQPGNSGGPIVDKDSGSLVGVATMKLSKDYTKAAFGVESENTNYGIKSSQVKDFLEANRSFMDSPALIIQNGLSL